MMNDAHWMDRSKPIDNLDIEISFALNGRFYTGDPNNSAQIQDKAYYEPFALPAFPLADEQQASTAEIDGHERLLADYYKRLLERASQVNKGFDQISHYFWMRMSLWNEAEDVRIGFSWYDHLSEMSTFIDWLATASEDNPFGDVEQGWQVDACVVGEHIHIRDVDPDSGEEHANVAVPRAALVHAARQVERRAAKTIAFLTEALGTDYWTYYRYPGDFGMSAPQAGTRTTLKASGIAQRLIARLTRLFGTARAK
jgi:hypothetical protein